MAQKVMSTFFLTLLCLCLETLHSTLEVNWSACTAEFCPFVKKPWSRSLRTVFDSVKYLGRHKSISTVILTKAWLLLVLFSFACIKVCYVGAKNSFLAPNWYDSSQNHEVCKLANVTASANKLQTATDRKKLLLKSASTLKSTYRTRVKACAREIALHVWYKAIGAVVVTSKGLLFVNGLKIFPAIVTEHAAPQDTLKTEVTHTVQE